MTKFDKPIPRLRQDQERKAKEATREKMRQSRLAKVERQRIEWETQMRARKVCPFCGSQEITYQENGMNTDWMGCKTCNATGPISDGRQQSIERWNKRAPNNDATFCFPVLPKKG